MIRLNNERKRVDQGLIMSEVKVRCTGCYGGKKVLGMGCIMIDCTVCNGSGLMLESQRAKPVDKLTPQPVSDQVVLKSVSKVIEADIEPITKVDGKRTIFKRKTASSKGV